MSGLLSGFRRILGLEAAPTPSASIGLDPAATSEVSGAGSTAVIGDTSSLGSSATQEPQGSGSSGDGKDGGTQGGTEGQEPGPPIGQEPPQGSEADIDHAGAFDGAEPSTLLDSDGGGFMADVPQLDVGDLATAGGAIELGDVLEP